MIEHIVAWYAPHRCLSCQIEGGLLCESCQDRLLAIADRCYRCRALSPGSTTCVSCRRQSKLGRVRAVTSYEGTAKQLIGRLKFSGAKAAAQSIASAMSQLDLPQGAIITHVPTATSRIRWRGYDQAALIAKALAYKTSVDYLPCLLRKGQFRQVGSSRQQRVQQMRDNFVVRRQQMVDGRHIVLIDDVMTTGATLEAAAATLRAAGASRVEAIVFARA